MKEDVERALERISAWWRCEALDRACVAFTMKRPGAELPRGEPNDFWPREDEEPDLEGLVEWRVRAAEATLFFGEALPRIPHAWGGRGTPMTIAAYLGGRVRLQEETVWVDPVVEDWESFPFEFDRENPWWKRGHRLFGLTIEASDGRFFPALPDYGDCLTVFSLLRGPEKLLFDVMDEKEKVVAARDAFLDLWPRYHAAEWKAYAEHFPGDLSWLVWAPGKTYALQCDFSTMLNPALFEELVVPEIESAGRYLDYIVWHLDGPDEIKYLDVLLELPEIKAVQWVPGAGKPTASGWIPMLKRIQSKGRALHLSVRDEAEARVLLRELSADGLFLSGGFTGGSLSDARDYIDEIARLSRPRR